MSGRSTLRTHPARRFGVAIGLLAIGACTTTITLGDGDPHIYPDGAPRVRCGAVDCDPGKICCNASCGVCAALGGCPAIPPSCADDAGTACPPDHLSLTGNLVCSHFVWNGIDCMEILGCTCTGDCTPAPETTYVACMERHAACWSRACDTHTFCPTGYVCERASCDASAVGTCTAIPTDCTAIASVATCGCDHIAYRSRCEAARARQSVSPIPACGACNPPAVTIPTGCATSLGWQWAGGCVERVGCACTGECDRLEPTEAACNARYQSACAGLFACGGASCRRGVELCEHGTMADSCIPSPAACAVPTCACLVAAGVTTPDGCTEDGAGGVAITTP